MLGEELVNRLNAYPSAAVWDLAERPKVYATIDELATVFQGADFQDRQAIVSALTEPAKYLFAEYTHDKAVSVLRTGSRQAVIEGLIPFVMAGGRSDTRTGGELLSLMLHSVERAGLEASDLFARVARLAVTEESAAQLREFPNADPSHRAIERFGFHERKTPEGITYEHQVEAMSRPRWYDRFIGRRRKSYAEVSAETCKHMDALYGNRQDQREKD